MFDINIEGPEFDAPHATIRDNAEGTYVVTWTGKYAGLYSIKARHSLTSALLGALLDLLILRYPLHMGQRGAKTSQGPAWKHWALQHGTLVDCNVARNMLSRFQLRLWISAEYVALCRCAYRLW